MKRIKNYIFIPLFFILMGCASTTRESVMNTWVGEPIDDLTAKMGAPTTKLARDDGGYVYTWVVFTEMQQCNTSYVTDAKGIIKTWSFSGCSKYVRAY
jgi:hypothetical protein